MPLAPSDARERSARTELRIFQGVSAAVVLAGLFLPLTKFPSICFFFFLTGLPCPGCGLTRSIHLLLNGQWAAALAMNPFGPPVLILLGLLLLSIVIKPLQSLYVAKVAEIHRLYAIGAILMMLFGVVRVVVIVKSGGADWIAPALKR